MCSKGQKIIAIATTPTRTISLYSSQTTSLQCMFLLFLAIDDWTTARASIALAAVDTVGSFGD